MSIDLYNSSARECAQAMRAGKLRPADLVDFRINQIQKFNPTLNALIEINELGAKKQAQKTPSAPTAGRLLGLTFSAKDHIDVAGLSRGEGSPATPRVLSTTSARAIELLLDAGAICIGKGNQAEYGKSYFTTGSGGRTNNPFDHQRTCGGSGGGDAVAVAAGFADFGIGVDTSGSIRVPANFCGLFGLAPTPGTISDAGLSSRSHTLRSLFRTIGCITKSLDDLELLSAILLKFDRSDPRSASIPLSNRRSTKKFGFFSALRGVSCDPAIQSALDSNVASLSKLGFQGTQLVPTIFEQSYEPWIVLAAQATLFAEDVAGAMRGTPRDLAKEGPLMQNFRKTIATRLPPLTIEKLFEAWLGAEQLRSAAAQLFEEYDFVLAPVAAVLPPLHGTEKFDTPGRSSESQEVFLFAGAVNLLGLPAIAFPTGITSQGLPVGLQIIGPRYSERELIDVLRVAGRCEAIRPKL